jgi:hypothetical protein
MIVWVKGSSVEMPCDQRAKVLEFDGEKKRLTVELCGTGALATVGHDSVVGVELSNAFSILFKVTGSRSSSRA